MSALTETGNIRAGLHDESVPDDEPVSDHFADSVQQREAMELGMWVFLATEIMFFGALFLAYSVYRYWYPAAFAAGSHHMELVYGTINTAVLLTSSLSMALAVNAAEQGRRNRCAALLLVTLILGSVFLVIKGIEYHAKWVENLVPFVGWSFAPTGELRGGLKSFFNLYFIMTGLHAVHLLIGIVLLAGLIAWTWKTVPFERCGITVHNVGLYWHLIDLVWVYLFPLFYLVGTVKFP